jgi:hypothetical protein
MSALDLLPLPHSENDIDPDACTAIASSLEQLTALKFLDFG